MSEKDVNDYLNDGMYGTRLPKEEELEKFLGTYRERIAIALTVGQVMSDKGLSHLEAAIKENQHNTKLLMNGNVSSRFLKEEKKLANQFNIPYTTVANQEKKTDIGAVLTYDYAINKEEIFINDEMPSEEDEKEESPSLINKIMQLFK